MLSLSSNTRRWLILTIVSSAVFLIVADVTVLYLALPALTRDLGATAAQKLWIVNAYALAVAALLPSTGVLADRYGHKRMFMSGMLVFAAGSILAAFSPWPEILIFARVVLAVGAAMMMPATLAIIRITFDDPTERAVAIGIWSAIASGGAAMGPVMGGLLQEYFWWGSVFLVNVPIVAIALVPAMRLLPRSERNPERSFDVVAAFAVMLAMLGLTLAIKTLSTVSQDWPVTLVALVVGTGSAVALVRRQRSTQRPLVDFSLFRNPLFLSGSLAALTACAVLLGMELAISQRFQLVDQLSALQAGLALLPIPLAAFVGGPLSGLYLERVGVARMLWGSLALAGVGFAGYAFLGETTLIARNTSFVIIGLSLGSAMTAASSAMLLSVSARKAGMAASIEEVSYELGAALGVAVLGSLLMVIYSASFVMPAGLMPYVEADPALAHHIDAALALVANLPEMLALDLLQAVHAAFDQAIWWTSLISAALSLGMAVVIVRITASSASKTNTPSNPASPESQSHA